MADDPNAATANSNGAAGPTRGDHPYVDILAAYPDESFAKNPVGEVEKSAIDKRRLAIKERPAAKDCPAARDRTGDCPLTGLALSGGGIRSVAFKLGALQAFYAYSGIEGIDYLSIVSGGGYIGCSLNTALAGCGDTKVDFPFTMPIQGSTMTHSPFTTSATILIISCRTGRLTRSAQFTSSVAVSSPTL